ncbi:MAG: isoleucine--tRNA ligase [Planctomycetota bacterium]
MFKEVPSQFDFPTEEKKTLDFWDANQIYHKSLEQRKEAPPFVFYEGPPTANGLPHPGHCLTRAIKDLFPRYKTMTGHYCHRRAGWDTHGLPVETEVCKELGIHSKEEIEKYGMEPFIHKCVESVFRYTKEWEDVTRRLGFWVDMDEAYVTYHQSYVESVWWALKSFFEAGLLYRGSKIVWWWAQGGTALSAGEVGQGYREVDDPSVFVRFPLLDPTGDEQDPALLVWTTTPWTLPSNTFAAVHPEIEYALVADSGSGEQFYVAAALVEAIGAKGKRELSVVAKCAGSALIGRRYRPPFDYYYNDLGDTRAALKEGGDEYVAWRVVAADFVTTESGTGLVHQAPAFGEVDYDVLTAERDRFVDGDAVPLLCAVKPDGTFSDDVDPKFAGRWVKEADKDLARALRESGLLYHQEQYRHDYPFCWRASEDPLIQYPRESWFVRTTQFVDDMLANNAEISWQPKHIQDGRFGKFLESNVDWSLSRERYWGTPLPIWVCEKTGHMEAIGSYDELLAKPGVDGVDVWESAKAADPELLDDLKVHRPYIDAITFTSPQDPSARMRRVPEVIDCWFDSGSMPFAQLGYPQRNHERFAAEFPADFISEALDQTRGWFYSLLAISTLLFGKNGVARRDGDEGIASQWPQPFRNCIVLGLLLGEDGTKMSKSLKNYKTPDYIFDEEGADAMRWLFFSGQAPWTSIRFQEKAIEEGQREYLIRLYNVYSFFVIYANIDGWAPSGGLCGDLPEAGKNELDEWIIGELHATTRDVRAAMDAFDNFSAAKRLSAFVDGLSNWYVRRSRDRFWKSGMDADKAAAYSTLYDCLVQMSLLTAPFTPFIAESLYQNLVRGRSDQQAPESVHLCDYPTVDTALICEELAEEMEVVREIVSLGRAVRSQEKLRVRQPLPQLEVVLADSALAARLARHNSLVAEELNVKSVDWIQQADEYVEYQVKPNFRSIGPRFGKLAPAIQKELKAVAEPAALLHELEANAKVCIECSGETVELTTDDVQVELAAKEGWAAAQGRTSVVVLKTEITPELLREGMARELVHHVQQLRKELDLAYEQRIVLRVEAADSDLAAAIEAHSEHVNSETLANELLLNQGLSGSGTRKDAQVEGHDLAIEVTPVS